MNVDVLRTTPRRSSTEFWDVTFVHSLPANSSALFKPTPLAARTIGALRMRAQLAIYMITTSVFFSGAFLSGSTVTLFVSSNYPVSTNRASVQRSWDIKKA